MGEKLYALGCGVLVVGGGALFINLVYWLFNRRAPAPFSDQQVSFAMQTMGVIATINALLLAFMAISVWDTYKAADASALNEASAVALLGRDLAYYGGPKALLARDGARAYAACVIKEEWPLLADGGSSPVCLEKLEDSFRLVAELEPVSGREKVLLGEVWGRTNDMSRCRRERLQAGRSSVPRTLWVVAAAGTVLTISLLFVLPPAVFTRVLLTMLTAAFGLVFYFIVAMSHPFAGPDAIRPVGFERVLRNMDNWDKDRAAQPGRRK